MSAKTKKTTPSQVAIQAEIDAGHLRVKDWIDLHRKFERMRDTGWIFRGVSSPAHYPIPSIGREKVFGSYKRAHEERLFLEFKTRASWLTSDPRFDDWDLLAYAQHIGVPTRLLDWTVNPLVAAFFALESESKDDRIIYAVKYSRYLYEVDDKRGSPFDNRQEGRFSAPHAFDRIRAQRGLFTIHPDPTVIFHPKGLKTFLIESSNVPDFRRRLFKYGADYWHVYPDGQGLGQQLSWQFKHKIGLGSVFMPSTLRTRKASGRP